MKNTKLSDIEVIAKEAAKEALKNFKKEQKEKFKKAVIHNTETLLNNFLEIQYFFENCEDSHNICDEEIVVNSLRKSKIATSLLYSHASDCFFRLSRAEEEKFKVIQYLYLDINMKNLSWDDRLFEIEETLKISRRTLYNWRNEMITKLSIMLFGADGYILLAM